MAHRTFPPLLSGGFMTTSLASAKTGPISASARSRAGIGSRAESGAPTDRVDYLDGWRGTAIGALLLGHFVAGFGVSQRYGINAGRLGVELFFVLSGLLMGNLLFVKKVRIRDFYKKRVSRIFPGLYFYLAAITVVLALVWRAHDVESVVSVLLLYFNYYAAPRGTVPVVYQHIWSLCIEEHCYILLSVIALVTRRWPVKDHLMIAASVLVSWGFAAGYTAFTDWDQHAIFWRTEARLGAVFVSAFLVCRLRDGHRPLVTGGWWLVPFAAGLASQLAWVPDLLKYTIGTTMLAISVTHLRFAWPRLVRPYRARWLMLLGTLSYSVYLWQQLFMAVQDRFGVASCLAGALGMGALSYYLVENPARTLINRVWVKTACDAPR